MYDWGINDQRLFLSETRAVAHPGLRKKMITLITCVEVVLRKRLRNLSEDESITWHGFEERVRDAGLDREGAYSYIATHREDRFYTQIKSN